jgi:hypothetical protein
MSGPVYSAMAPYAINRVLGGSGWVWRTFQRKEGDVVLLLPTLPYEGVKLLHEEVPQRFLLTAPRDESTKSRKAEHLALRIMSLYQPVAVEEGAIASIEHYLLHLVAHPRHQTQGHPPSP